MKERKTNLAKSAIAAVKAAVDRGKISKPTNCQKCGKPSRWLHAHHEDYAKPLEVVWMCPGCHRKKHHRPKRTADRQSHLAIDKIIAFREDWELSQGELAQLLGVTRAAVNHWESGIRAIPEHATKLIDCLIAQSERKPGPKP